MRILTGIAAFLWDFIVGDDWTAAAGVVLLLGLVAVASRAGVNLWWTMPIGVIAILALTLRRATHTPS